MTPQQFDATPESAWDGRYRYELINGVLIVTPPVSDAEVVKETQTYQTDLLPGFELPLSRLLAKADDWAPSKRSARMPNPPSGGTDG